MAEYRQVVEPEIVQRAEERSRQFGFTRGCRPETGQILAVLTSTIRQGRILELGTGGAYGTAWIASALRDTASLITIDRDERLAASNRELFSEFPNVEVLAGSWEQALKHRPFDLVFVDVSDAKHAGADRVINSLEPGAIAVLDDLTPVELWPDEWIGKPDPVRDVWLSHPALRSCELRVAHDHAVILSVRK